jgi:hypothetical protein
MYWIDFWLARIKADHLNYIIFLISFHFLDTIGQKKNIDREIIENWNLL